MGDIDAVVMGIAVGDVVELRKQHPCGSSTWRVRRVGGDIGLICEGCGRRMFMSRAVLRRRARTVTRPAGVRPVD